jgi:MarR-like DNA-binding transcriptional regulator SgrR of sgrS sRNA
MNRVFDDVKSLMALKGMSIDTLAATLYKEPASIRKQLNPVSANPQLSTLVQIASAIGGEVRVLPVDSEDESVEAYRNRLALFQQEREQMLTDAARLNEIIEQQRITIETQAQQMEELHKERDMRVRYLGKVFDDLDAEIAENKELRTENRKLIQRILELKGVEI